MKIDGNVVIKYNDFHIPFNQYDDFCFAVEAGSFNRLRAGHIQSAGMQTLFDTVPTEDLLDMIRQTDDVENAGLRVITALHSTNGEPIDMAAIAAMMDEQDITGEPLSKLARKMQNVERETFISAGEGIPDIAKRTPHKPRH